MSQLKLAIVPAVFLIVSLIDDRLYVIELTCRGCVILEAVLLWRHHIAALILSYLYLPLPGGGGGQSVDINVYLVTLSGGRDEHVLASIVATDSGRGRASGVAHSQSVHSAVSHGEAVRCSYGGGES